MKMFDAIAISGSALAAERQRSEVIATNMANSETTRTAAGGPFHRRQVVFAANTPRTFGMTLAGMNNNAPPAGMVRVSEVVDDPTPAVMRYEPGHPDADKDGYVAYPAINPALEMVDLMGSVRAYQLNASAISAEKQMIQQSIDILKA
jgi:flagellar basal-body rod protein FlgC